MKISCIIPARGGSKGILKKNIINFLDNPLISYSIHQALKSEYIDDVYISSDDTEILDVALENGAKTISRPIEISGDCASSESALIHALESIEEKPDIIVFLQATSPLRISEDIDNAIKKLLSKNYDSVFSACNLEDFFVWEVKENSLVSINYDYENRKRRQEISNQIVENGSIYVFKVPPFLVARNRLCGKIGFSIMESWKVHEIDSLSDLGLCEFIYKQRIREGKQ